MIKLLALVRARKAHPYFWRHVDFHGAVPEQRPDLGPCWLWLGHLDKDGYGLASFEGKTCRVHRVSYELLVASLDDIDPSRPAFSITIDHICRVRRCVNPDHMEPVPSATNVARGIAGKVRGQTMSARTHCPRGHEYSGSNLYVGPDGKRRCVACNRADGARRRAAKRQSPRLRIVAKG
jgi:hypothetical protein